ncbi:plastocyanin/azurin family copper-binding protein [Halalkalibaculum sp. DA384]|uniref:plastocyanin/azurin family copper-binding protein n=1 Tax=Halalkalibaculum sp. DA384 TaxID=3373606 RepID=UPI0037550E09
MKFLPITGSLLLLFLFPVIALHAQDSSEEIRTIEIIGSDQMQFDVTEINASPGEEIKIVLTTESNLPKVAMAHNVVVLKQDVDAKAFASAAATARNDDFIPPKLTDQIIAYTGLAGGGETVEVTFTVPEETGSYTYICSFPGHFAAGMKGTIVVE